ncbi:hypothetical protein LRS74_21675 [Streptomyces sp. LX-29]|uniref:hypothetical protein n=1 Tax=Streptomyces sp. LX-29 TaxID=2900152 RepID=UPI00240CFCCC|nr:hypothetical protein [Streptomyces sp. LX-29]WFB09360.1 hypothetical protein LRS74_21675 [Streptomyces sp. LX-29]
MTTRRRTTSTAQQAWWPHSGQEIKPHPAGEAWDAVRVPTLVGELVLERLGADSGAVIDDPFTAVWYWLVRPGAAADWTLQRVLSKGAFVAVPPRERTYGPGPHWRVPPGPDRCLTDADRLHAALLAAMGMVKYCLRCERLTAEPVAVVDVHGGSGAGRTLYACEQCALHFPTHRDPFTELAAAHRARQEGRSR